METIKNQNAGKTATSNQKYKKYTGRNAKGKTMTKLKQNEIKSLALKAWNTSEPDSRVNIHHVVGHSEDFAWGYKGTGAFDLSLNVLLHYSGGNLEFAKEYAADFVTEVISELTEREATTLPASLIMSWVEPRMQGLVKSVHGAIEQAPVQEAYLNRKAEFIKGA